MITCKDCGQVIKHAGNNVWIDHTQGDCCYITNESHQPIWTDPSEVKARSKESILAEQGQG